jgi:hypothetical protein
MKTKKVAVEGEAMEDTSTKMEFATLEIVAIMETMGIVAKQYKRRHYEGVAII